MQLAPPAKAAIVEAVIHALSLEVDSLDQSARAAYETATHNESRAENKYDTRGLLASYLAEAQARRLAEIQKAIGRFRNMKLRTFDDDEPIALGALVALSCDDATPEWYFLGPDAGGLRIQLDQTKIQILTAQAPLGKAMLGQSLDDEFSLALTKGKRVYLVTHIS